jgi:glycosyltransferase involved in cell wall biosynthesis
MKILFLHNRYLISGGEDISTDAEIQLLRDYGHQVDSYYISNQEIADKSKVKLFIRTIWSLSSYKELKRLIRLKKYDIIHVQNFFPLLSPSVFYAARSQGVKIVMSVRNYRLVCPNALLFVNGEVCTKCLGHTFPYMSVIKKCYKSSRLSSMAVASMLSVHNLLNTWNGKVDGFICISEFVKSQLILGGIHEDKLHVKYNFLKSLPIRANTERSGFLYVGRLSTEKGIDTMLEAFIQLSSSHPQAILTIIGEGPLSAYVEDASLKYDNIIFIGRKHISEVYEIMSTARFLMFPSKWHEPFGRTIVESFAAGTPVIGASVGGVTELVKDGYNGFLFEGSNTESLKSVLIKALDYNIDELSVNSRQCYTESYTPVVNYSQVISIYEDILKTPKN